MNAFPDTSFLCALYRLQYNSEEAVRFYKQLDSPLRVTTLVLFEFRQSLRLQVHLYGQDKRKGFSKNIADAATRKLQENIAAGALVVIPADWADVHAIAERLSAKHTERTGQRALDILHVATALHFGAKQFLSYDSRQRALAKAEGMESLPNL